LHIQSSSAPFEVKFHSVFACTTTDPFLKARLFVKRFAMILLARLAKKNKALYPQCLRQYG